MRAGEIDRSGAEDLHHLLAQAVHRPEPAAALTPRDEVFFRRGHRRSGPLHSPAAGRDDGGAGKERVAAGVLSQEIAQRIRGSLRLGDGLIGDGERASGDRRFWVGAITPSRRSDDEGYADCDDPGTVHVPSPIYAVPTFYAALA